MMESGDPESKQNLVACVTEDGIPCQQMTQFRCMIKRLKNIVYGKLHKRRVERLHKKRCSELEVAKRKRKAERIYEQMKVLQTIDINHLTCHVLLEFGHIQSIDDDEQREPVEKVQYMMVYWAMKDKGITEAITTWRIEHPKWKDIIQNTMNSETSAVTDRPLCQVNKTDNPKSNQLLNQKRRKKQKIRKKALFEALQSVVGELGTDSQEKNTTVSEKMTNDKDTVCVNADNAKLMGKKAYAVNKRIVPKHIYKQKLIAVKKQVREENRMKVAKKKLVKRQTKLMEVRPLHMESFELLDSDAIKKANGSIAAAGNKSRGVSGAVSRPISSFFVGGTAGDSTQVTAHDCEDIQQKLVDISTQDSGGDVSPLVYTPKHKQTTKPSKYDNSNDSSKGRQHKNIASKTENKSMKQRKNEIEAQPTLHPSWQAKRRDAQRSTDTSFQGKRVKFDDDDD